MDGGHHRRGPVPTSSWSWLTARGRPLPRRHTACPSIERLDSFARICSGVQDDAHENLVVHRDIKPDNVLVSRDGTPKLLDFGVAKIASRRRGAPSTGRTRRHLADDARVRQPEQLAGHGGGMASDIYSLGVLLYVLLAGARPYRLHGSTAAELRTQLAGTAVQPPSSRVRRGPEAEERAAPAARRPRNSALQAAGRPRRHHPEGDGARSRGPLLQRPGARAATSRATSRSSRVGAPADRAPYASRQVRGHGTGAVSSSARSSWG